MVNQRPATDPRDDVLVEVRGLSTEFATADGAIRAVDDVDLTIRRGEILGVVGESGSGKSITAKSIIRLVPKPGRVVAGEIWFNGRNLLELSEREMQDIRGAHIGLILQEPMTSLNPVLTIGEQIEEVLEHHRDRAPAGRSLRDSVVDILGRVRIPDAVRRLSAYPFHFSGGMRQRVSIGIATVARPDLVIADEPTTALDVTIQAQVLDLLLDLRKEFGVSVLFITHDLGVIAQLCDSVAVMYAGKIVEYRPVEDLFADPQHPYTKALLASLPEIGTRLDRLSSIEGQPPDLGALPLGCSFAERCPAAIDRCRAEDPGATPIEPGSTSYVRCWVAAENLRTPLAPAHAQEARS